MTTLPLTDNQVKAFNKLKAAYKACEKAGIYFANVYGNLQAYDKSLVKEYADSDRLNVEDGDVISNHFAQPSHEMRIPNEWCDDEHLIKLTPKGVRYLRDDDDDDDNE